MTAILFLVVLILPLHSQPSGVLAGRLTFADTGSAAAGVSIRCAARDDATVVEATTDEEGRFECRVPTGIYTITPQLPKSETRHLALPHGATRVGHDGRAIRVHANERAEIALALILSGSISGRVTDTDGAPLSGAVVIASAAEEDNPGADVYARRAIASGDEGAFSITGLPPGMYRVRAEAARKPDTAESDKDDRPLLPTWFPGTTDPRESIPVHVGSDDLTGLDLRVLRGKPATIAGRVHRADGSPASMVDIALMIRAGGALYALGVRTDSTGAFRFPRVPPGTYELVANVGGDFPERIYESIAIEDGEAKNVALTLRGTTSVKGRVRFEGGEFPKGTLNVSARGVNAPLPLSQTSIDDEHGFELQKTFGTRLIRVDPLPKGWWLKSVAVARRSITNQPVDMTDGLVDVEVLVSRRMSTIKGTITHTGNELPADTLVVAFSHDSSQWVPLSTVVARVWPHDDATFGVEGLPAGSYFVTAVENPSHALTRLQPAALQLLRPRAALVEIGEAETIEAQIPLVRMEER